jgi:hypothetical protein
MSRRDAARRAERAGSRRKTSVLSSPSGSTALVKPTTLRSITRSIVSERLAQGLVQRLPLIDYGTRPAVLEQGPLRLREAALEHTDDQVLADVGARLGGPLPDVLLVQAHD